MRNITPRTDPRCIIVGAGANDVLPLPPRAQDLLIAADGGLDFLHAHGLAPQLVIGDFDSVRNLPSTGTDVFSGTGELNAAGPAATQRVISLPAEKDDTDMTSAVKLGWSRGHSLFHIYGGLGGRLDHTLANLQLLASIATHGGIGFLHSRDTVVTALSQARLHFPSQPLGAEGAEGADSANSAIPTPDSERAEASAPEPVRMVSVFSLSDTAENVTVHGLKYEVGDATFRNTLPLGVSNEHVGIAADISVGKGILIVTFPPQLLPDSVALQLPLSKDFGSLTTRVSTLLAH